MDDSPTSSLFTFLSENGTSDIQSTLTSRLDSSLGVITKKFLKLLRESPDMEVDLNYAASTLQIHKRRLYDITNVLEGIGYIRKKSKNHVRYVGGAEGRPCEDCGGVLLALERGGALEGDSGRLRAREKELDRELAEVNEDLQRLANEEDNIRLAYVTYSDLKSLGNISSISLFAVRTPPGTILDFPASENRDENILTLTAPTGKIDVFYIQDGGMSEE